MVNLQVYLVFGILATVVFAHGSTTSKPAFLRIREAGRDGKWGPILRNGLKFCPEDFSTRGFSILCYLSDKNSRAIIFSNKLKVEERYTPFYAAGNNGDLVYPLKVHQGMLRVACFGNAGSRVWKKILIDCGPKTKDMSVDKDMKVMKLKDLKPPMPMPTPMVEMTPTAEEKPMKETMEREKPMATPDMTDRERMMKPAPTPEMKDRKMMMKDSKRPMPMASPMAEMAPTTEEKPMKEKMEREKPTATPEMVDRERMMKPEPTPEIKDRKMMTPESKDETKMMKDPKSPMAMATPKPSMTPASKVPSEMMDVMKMRMNDKGNDTSPATGEKEEKDMEMKKDGMMSKPMPSKKAKYTPPPEMRDVMLKRMSDKQLLGR